MTYQTIRADRVGDRVTLILNRPDRLNALNGAMVAELNHLFAELKRHPPRVLVLTGAGRGFCAGADLLDAVFDPADLGGAVAAAMAATFNPMTAAFQALPFPKIAAVNGVAAGGGASIALLADIVVAARSARFVQVFGPNLGLVPDLGATWSLPRLVGRARARGLALLGDSLDAATAADWGLIWQAVPDDQLTATVDALAARLAGGPTQAFAEIGRLFDESLDRSLPDQLEAERQAQGKLAAHPDFAEALAAFAAKRPPRFNGPNA